jgi:hypothetical protein
MADLLSVANAKTFLGLTVTTYDTLLTQLVDELEGLFESDCGRKDLPFAAAAEQEEVRDGTGTCELFVDYPIEELTSIKLGLDPDDPDEELDVSDPTVLVYGAGKRRITRTDGGIFGYAQQPRYVHLVYDAQDDLPPSATLAIKRGIAMVFRQRGSEDALREALADYSHDLARIQTEDFWLRAVAAEHRGAWR